MKEYRSDLGGPGVNPLVTIWAVQRVVVSLFGIVVMVAGLSLAVNIFNAIYGGVMNPAAMETVVGGWSRAIGGEQKPVISPSVGFSYSRLTAVGIMAAAGGLLVFLALRIIVMGGRMTIWSAEDRQTVENFVRAVRGRDQPSPLQSGS